MTRKERSLPPPSCTPLWLNCVSVLMFLATHTLITRVLDFTDVVVVCIISSIGAITPTVLMDLFYYRRYKSPTSGLQDEFDLNWKRIGVKLVGFYGTLGFVAFVYWLFPEYHGSFYNNFYELAKILFIMLMVVGWYYFIEVDMRMKQPKDSYWHMGMLLLGKWREVEKPYIAEHFRSWIVKLFFLPLMFTYICQNVNYLMHYNYNNFWDNNPMGIFGYFYSMTFTMDLIFASVGYLMTLRVLDSHTRSVEPTMTGWVVTLFCYQPMWGALFGNLYVVYEDGFNWETLMMMHPEWTYFYGGIIVTLMVMYSMATVSMGYRFSNLTYRGLFSSGMYRFSKHPAYITKVTSWWLISLPFLPMFGWENALRNTILLFLLSTIYFLRARTEENHLSNYPEYVEYGNWMNEHGVFRWVGRLIPYFRYDSTRAQRANSVVWWRQTPLKLYRGKVSS